MNADKLASVLLFLIHFTNGFWAEQNVATSKKAKYLFFSQNYDPLLDFKQMRTLMIYLILGI